MNLKSHFIINGIIGLSLRLDLLTIGFIILGGILIDFDHVIYQYFKVKNKSIKKMLQWHIKEKKIKSHHYFPFHFLEIGIILSIGSYFINQYLFWFFIGVTLHIITDLVEHLIFHKNLTPLEYYTLTGYFIKKL